MIVDEVQQQPEIRPYLGGSSATYHKAYDKDVYKGTFENTINMKPNYKPLRLFNSNELVDHIRKYLPLTKKNVKAFEEQITKLNLTFGNLISKGFHIDDFLQRFFVVIDKRLRLFFEHMDNTVIKKPVENVPSSFQFSQLRVHVHQKLIEISNDLVNNFGTKSTPVEYDRLVLKNIEQILRVYDSLRYDKAFHFLISITKFNLNVLLQKVCDNDLLSIHDQQAFITEILVTSMKSLREQTNYLMESSTPIFLLNKEVVLDKFHQILKDKTDSCIIPEDVTFICQNLIAKDRRVLFNEFHTQITKELKEIAPEFYQYSTVKKSEYQTKREDLQRTLSQIYQRWSDLKQDETYYLVLDDRINEDLLAQVPLQFEEQLHQIQRLNQFQIKASNLQYDIVDLFKEILKHKESSRSIIESKLQEAVSASLNFYDNQVPGRNPYSPQIQQYIDELFNDLHQLLKKDPNQFRGKIPEIEDSIQKQIAKSKNNPYLQNVQKDLIRQQQTHEQMQKLAQNTIKQKSEFAQAQIDHLLDLKQARELQNESQATRPFQPVSEGKVMHGSSVDYHQYYNHQNERQYNRPQQEPGKYQKQIEQVKPQQISRDPYVASKKGGYYTDQIMPPKPTREQLQQQQPQSRQKPQEAEVPKRQEAKKEQPSSKQPERKPDPPKEQPKKEPPKEVKPEVQKKPDPPKEQPKAEPPKKQDPPKEVPKQPEPPKKPEPPKEVPKQPEPPKKVEPPKEVPKQPEPPKKVDPPKEVPKQPEPPKKPEPPKEVPKQPEPPKKVDPPKEVPKQPEPPKKVEPPKEAPKQPEPPKKPDPPKEAPKVVEPPKKPEPPKEVPKQPEPPKKPEPPKEVPKQPEPPKKVDPPKEVPKQPEPPKKPEPPKEIPKQPEPPKKPEPSKEQPKQPEPPKKPEPPKEVPKQPEPPKKPEPPKEEPKHVEPPKKVEPPKEIPKQPEVKQPEPHKDLHEQHKKPEPVKEVPKKQDEQIKKVEPGHGQNAPIQQKPIQYGMDSDEDEDYLGGYQPQRPQQQPAGKQPVVQAQPAQQAPKRPVVADEVIDFGDDEFADVDPGELDKLGEGEDEESAFDQIQLVTNDNLNLLNSFIKSSKYGKANKVNLDEFNVYDYIIQLFEEFIVQDEAYFLDFEETMLLLEVNDKMLNDEDPNEEIELFMKTMSANFQQRTQKPSFGPAQRLFFPFEQNPFLFYMLEKDPLNRRLNIYFDEEPGEDIMGDEFNNLIGIFQQLFDCEDFELAQIVVDPVSLQQFDQLGPGSIYLKYMLTIFSVLFEQQSPMPQVKITQQTIERMYWSLHASTLFYEELQNGHDEIEQFFGNIANSQDKSCGVLQQSAEYNEADINALHQIIEQTKAKFQKDKSLKQFFILIEIESPEAQLKFSYFIHLSRVSTISFLKLFVLQHYDQMNDTILGIFLSDDGQFTQKVYLDYARHNFQYEYGLIHFGAWMHLVNKKNLKVEDAMAVLSMSIAPYYVIYKKLD